MNLTDYISEFNILPESIQCIDSERSKLSKSIYDGGESASALVNETIDRMQEVSTSYFNSLTDHIKKFFMDDFVETSTKHIYDALKGNEKSLAVETQLLYGVYGDYSSYLNGFADFIKIVLAIKTKELDKDRISEKLDNIDNNDAGYLLELFSPSYVKKEDSYISISDAMSNVEFLVSFIEIIKYMMVEINDIFTIMRNSLSVEICEDSTLTMLKIRACISYITSLMRFSDSIVKRGIQDFIQILGVLNDPKNSAIIDEQQDRFIKLPKDENEFKIV